MEFIVKGYKPVEDNWKVDKIRYYFDRHERMWCFCLLDMRDVPVRYQYAPKHLLNTYIFDLKEEYAVTDCRKYKKGE